FRLLAPLLVASSLIGAGCGLIEPTPGPLPPVSDIRSMIARYYDLDRKQLVEFDVSKDHWGEILDALRPSSFDSNPSKWRVLGKLDIKRQDDRPFAVQLYSVSPRDGRQLSGAFSAGETYKDRKYYRGGTTAKLRAALEAASKAPGVEVRPVGPPDPY